MKFKNLAAICFTSAVFLGAATLPAGAQATLGADSPAGSTTTHSILTIVPKKNAETLPTVNTANVAVKVDGKSAGVAGLSHYGNSQANLQLILLLDDSARSSLGLYFKEMTNFLTTLPPNAAVTVAYIENGSARFLTPFTTDHAAAAKTLHLTSSPPGANADPYFALASIVQQWPGGIAGNGTAMRREIVMVSDGVDPYYGLRYDPSNPYVTKASDEATKHGVVVYSIYYKDRGRADRFGVAINSGQNYLIQLSEATGGELYYQGFDNPVSFAPFFEQISHNLMNQYELDVRVPDKVKDGLQRLQVKVNVPNTKTASPSQIFVGDVSGKN
jgi:hypothetical protein